MRKKNKHNIGCCPYDHNPHTHNIQLNYKPNNTYTPFGRYRRECDFLLLFIISYMLTRPKLWSPPLIFLIIINDGEYKSVASKNKVPLVSIFPNALCFCFVLFVAVVQCSRINLALAMCHLRVNKYDNFCKPAYGWLPQRTLPALKYTSFCTPSYKIH